MVQRGDFSELTLNQNMMKCMKIEVQDQRNVWDGSSSQEKRWNIQELHWCKFSVM